MATEYYIVIKKKAEKELDKLPEKDRKKVYSLIRGLKLNQRPAGCSKLKLLDGWRIRSRDYRIIYEINDATREVTIVGVKHRKDAYK